MMDMWHESVIRKADKDIGIMVGNRRKHPALSKYKGLNTQLTVSNLGVGTDSKKPYLVVWYDPFEIKYMDLLREHGYTQDVVDTIGPMLEAGIDLGRIMNLLKTSRNWIGP